MAYVSYAGGAAGGDVVRPKLGGSYPVKRVLDVAAALAILTFFMPVLVILAVSLKLSAGGSVLFRQQRVGQGGVEFSCLKFRTMRADAAQALAALLEKDPAARLEWEQNQKLTNDPRVHWLGRILRVSNLDELPQLFNVLLGDMSMVGPRPIVANESHRYGEMFEIYKAMKPGLTGIWQVRRRKDTTYEERVAMDVEYYESASTWFDAKIIMQTVLQVLTAKGSG